MKPIGLKKTLGISNVFLDDLTRALTEEQKRCIEEFRVADEPYRAGFFLGEANACSKALAWIDKIENDDIIIDYINRLRHE